MYYVYVLHSQRDKKLYTGFTDDLKRRLKEHNAGEEPSTKHRIPFELIYYEGCVGKEDAIAREKYLKSGKGKRYIHNRLKEYFGRNTSLKQGRVPFQNTAALIDKL